MLFCSPFQPHPSSTFQSAGLQPLSLIPICKWSRSVFPDLLVPGLLLPTHVPWVKPACLWDDIPSLSSDLFHPHLCPHPLPLFHPGYVNSILRLSLEKQWNFKNLVTVCSLEEPSRAAPWGCKVWQRVTETWLCLGSKTGKRSQLFQHSRYQFHGGRTRSRNKLQVCVVSETWVHHQRTSSCSSNLQ